MVLTICARTHYVTSPLTLSLSLCGEQRARATLGERVNLVHRLDRGASGCVLCAFPDQVPYIRRLRLLLLFLLIFLLLLISLVPVVCTGQRHGRPPSRSPNCPENLRRFGAWVYGHVILAFALPRSILVTRALTAAPVNSVEGLTRI